MLEYQEQLAREHKYKPIPRTFFCDVRAEFQKTLPEWCNISGDTTPLETTDGTGENGKTATVVQVEGSNILLITERYANGIRVASCWNTQKRRYGLQEHDDYIFVRKDGSVTHKPSRDVFVFPKTKRA